MARYVHVIVFFLATLTVSCALSLTSVQGNQLPELNNRALLPYVFDSGMPPRLQWLHNGGYCGEVSAIAAGLKYGQYLSQYDMRDIATGSQLKYYLVGENDEATAVSLRLNHSEYPNTCVPDKQQTCSKIYLAWVKAMARRGYAVTLALYMNYYYFYGDTSPTAGQVDYDHIVSLFRIESNFDDDLYHDEDIITISDHGLWAPHPSAPQFLFTYNFSEFQGNREQANSKHGNIYTLSDEYVTGNFGIAHLGPVDHDSDLLRVNVSTSVNYEKPEIADHSQVRPDPAPLTLTITIFGVQNGVAYNLYKYSDETHVPTSSFNKHNSSAAETLRLVGGESPTLVVVDTVQSSDKVIFRAVRADAK